MHRVVLSRLLNVEAVAWPRLCRTRIMKLSSSRGGRDSSGSVSTDKENPAKTVLEENRWREFRKKQSYGHEQWRPRKRLTWYQIDHLKELRNEQPEKWTPVTLANAFGVSVSSVNRILRSKFEPSPEVKERQDAKAIAYREQKREQSERDHRQRPYNRPIDY